MSGWQGVKQLHAEGGKVAVYNGMMDCFAKTIKEEGFMALFKVRCCRELLLHTMLWVWPHDVLVVILVGLKTVTCDGTIRM